ncbi:hypothetical protein RRG08_022767 [Elysia crispata]|uniref:PiggyBac transposable element-derived protein domain-containing protein n=1 Tax=Elysia crispata TaxID=231223 RepID=A0AAE0ZX73_9GAST|nr:hypothetical protein RRG08_022767 [Elysia crispata]
MSASSLRCTGLHPNQSVYAYPTLFDSVLNQERLAPWIPDDDDDDDEVLANARADIESSDESSDEDEYPDLLLLLLAESDPELEDEEEIIQEDSDTNNEITLPMSKDKSLVAYKSKDKKRVVFMITMHHSADVDQEGKKKPDMVKYYNETKGGVDIFDYVCHSFSCNRKTRRWQMVLFYNLLDTATVASHIIYKEVFPVDTKSYKDRGFLNEFLAKDLQLEHLMRRMGLAKTTKRVKLGSSLEQGSMPTEENLFRRTEQPVSPTKTSPDRDHRIYGSHRYIYVRFQHPPIKVRPKPTEEKLLWRAGQE